jgi:hypothetical protein
VAEHAEALRAELAPRGYLRNRERVSQCRMEERSASYLISCNYSPTQTKKTKRTQISRQQL